MEFSEICEGFKQQTIVGTQYLRVVGDKGIKEQK